MEGRTEQKVVIADGSLFIRSVLTSTLKSLGFNVVAACRDSDEAVDRCLALEPDVVLLDLPLADMNNFAPVRVIASGDPSAAIIMMVPEIMDKPDVIVRAVRAGVNGYILKPLSPNEIVASIGGMRPSQNRHY